MRSGSASSILGCMHPWTLPAASFPAVPLLVYLPFPLQGRPCLLASFLPPGAVLGLSAFPIRSSVSTAWAEWSLPQGLVKDAGGLFAALVPTDPTPGAEAGPPGDRRLHPQNSQIPLVCPPSVLPAQTSSSLAYPASVFCLLTPSIPIISGRTQNQNADCRIP